MVFEAIRPRLSFAAVALAAVVTMLGAVSPVKAQYERRYGPPAEGFNPFRMFTPLFQRPQREYREPRHYRERPPPRRASRPARPPAPAPAPVEQTKPPPPQKAETTPTKRIVVMGSSLSDWLAYGLEEIFSEQPDIGIVRKNHLLTGLVRFDARDETTWPQVARDFLKDQNPDVIVVMLGLDDRLAIRERAPAREPQEGQGEAVRPAPEPRRRSTQSFEFGTDQWADVYAKRIDDMIAALKSRGAPVIWVGLPSIRGTRSTSDMIYLNDLFRARAEKANIVYVDVWDGFVDESGRFAMHGPDVEGQVRRLRTSEGVFFTKSGARKLAHYVEREIKRVMGTRLQPVALPGAADVPQPAVAQPGEPAAPPVAGPVLPLTNAASANELLGGGKRSGAPDPLAVRVLTRGATVAPQRGRADNFFLTPEAEEAAKTAAAPEPAPAAVMPPADANAAANVPAGELLGGEEAKPAAKNPVASADPAAPAARRRAPARAAVRSGDNRSQQPSRPMVQKKHRPNNPRNGRTVERRPPAPQRPGFDPFGIFR